MMPQMHYGEEDCLVPAPSSFPKEDDLHFEIELIDFSKAKVIDKGQCCESPREPYEVKAWISAKTDNGKLILSHTEGELYLFTFGKCEVGDFYVM
ncbi:hypothetical protein V6N12_050003 [Hibiscus sabdariffa]|uniref:Peptidylprolyl isomerase n=1 Tax=Hibiscus sabdariffa TaxID=183260 RepID=A0ABR2GBF4_9ROSI